MNSNAPVMRKASHSDKTILTHIIRESFRPVADRFGLTQTNCPKHPSNCTEQWITDDFERGVDYYLLEYHSKPVGCVAFERPAPEYCYLERLAVLPGEQSRGYGKMLVDYIIGIADIAGIQEIRIGIISDHTELKQWYRKLGFCETGRKAFPHLPFQVAFMSYTLPIKNLVKQK